MLKKRTTSANVFKVWINAYCVWKGERGKMKMLVQKQALFLLCCKFYLNAICHLQLFSAISFTPKPARACHSVNASMQNLLQMVQHYGPQILQKPAEVAEPRCLYKPARTTSQCKVVPPDSKKSVSICDNLSELLIAMQEELDQMNV